MEKLKKHGFQIALLISVIILSFGVFGYLLAEEGLKEQSLVSTPLLITYMMVLIGAALTIGLPLIKSLKHPKTLINTGLSFGAVLLVLVISYSTANGIVPQSTDGTYVGITSSNLKLAGSLISTAVILVVVGIASLIVLEVKSLIKG